jgi:tetratricopeptide (TPR) repeat protein
MSVPTPASGTGPDSDPARAPAAAQDLEQDPMQEPLPDLAEDSLPDEGQDSAPSEWQEAAQPAAPPSGAVPPAPPPRPPTSPFLASSVVRKRRRKRKRQPPYLAIAAGLMLLALAGVMVGMGIVYVLNLRTAHAAKAGADALAGYISDGTVVDREYLRYYGKPNENSIPAKQFQRAGELARAGTFAEAAEMLEGVAREAAIPAVFNNLGVLYARLNDWQRAGTAFREALARDPKYPDALANLDRLKGFTADVAAPLTREIEPNNNRLMANLISVGTPVEGEVAAGMGDIDFFRCSFPPAPRDVLAVELTNHDYKFSPRLDVYDGNLRVLDWGRKTAEAGNSLTLYGSAAPNSTIYVAVSGADGTSGRYVLTLKPMKAFDEYEPNDDLFHAHRIDPISSPEGRLEYAPIKANIMDRDDTDYFSFQAGRTGKATVEVHNESVALIPAVQMYGPDMRSIGFGPTLRNPGESLVTTMDVEKGQIYYVQVWSQATTSGPYTLTVH